jgi:hypothetical protein
MPPARRRLSLHRIAIAWILLGAPPSPSWAQDQTLPPQKAVDPVATRVARVDTAAIRTRLEQLTGLAPIDTPNGPLTVASRYATKPEMVTLVERLVAELRGLGYDAAVDTFQSPAHGNRELTQFVATKSGTDLKGEVLLVTAHLDAVANCPGADDNASGVAAILEAARVLADLPLRRTVQFVAFNAEEQGLIGSRDLARRLAAKSATPGGPKVVGVLNLDMVAFDADGDRRIQLQTNREADSIRLVDRLKHAAADFKVNLHLVKVTDLEESSDYASFWRVGMPAINIGDEYFLCDDDVENPAEKDVTPPRGDFTPCYHKACDRLDDPAFRVDLVAEVARLLVAGVADLAEMAAGP